MSKYPKIGDVIILKKDKINKTEIKYIVLQVKDWSNSGSLSAENHGSLVIKEYKPHITAKVEEEEIEHYSLYKWNKYFKVVTDNN